MAIKTTIDIERHNNGPALPVAQLNVFQIPDGGPMRGTVQQFVLTPQALAEFIHKALVLFPELKASLP